MAPAITSDLAILFISAPRLNACSLAPFASYLDTARAHLFDIPPSNPRQIVLRLIQCGESIAPLILLNRQAGALPRGTQSIPPRIRLALIPSNGFVTTTVQI